MSSGLERQPGARSLRSPRLRLRGWGQRSPRQELWLALLLGALGAGLIFLATRQAWAQIRTIPPKPLPASTVTVTGAALVPYADALVVAGLATLAAVLASKGLLRRLAGVLLGVIGVAVGASAFSLTRAGAISAASSNVSPETAAAGSVTAGSGSVSAAVPDVAGTAAHVVFAAAGWQAIVVIGAIGMVAAGLLVVARSGRMAVMSSRYDSPAGAAGRQTPSQPAGRGQPAGTGPYAAAGPASGGGPASGAGRTSEASSAGGTVAAAEAGEEPLADSATLWESLSRGEDPTSAGSRFA
jgi:uncharacterized membrane protein (TIGR02234 family)